MSRDLIQGAVRGQDLGPVWTAERALQYLLLGGLLADAVWFIRALGDWRAAFSISAVVERHRRDTADESLRSGIRFLVRFNSVLRCKQRCL